jgi:hypothetical protein
MNLANLHNRLIAAARNIAPDERVPYAFEKRIMARLAAARADVWTLWSRALWRAAAPCVAIVVLSAVWSLWTQHQPASAEFSQEFETAVFASASPNDAW